MASFVCFCLNPATHGLPLTVGAMSAIALLILLRRAIPLRPGLLLFINLPSNIPTEWSERQGGNGYHQDGDCIPNPLSGEKNGTQQSHPQKELRISSMSVCNGYGRPGIG